MVIEMAFHQAASCFLVLVGIGWYWLVVLNVGVGVGVWWLL